MASEPMDDDFDETKETEAEAEFLIWLGPVLAKAVEDPFDYLVVLKTGQRIRFQEASYKPGSRWILLTPASNGRGDHGPGFEKSCGLGHPCPRGIQIKLDDILFVADAPDGS